MMSWQIFSLTTSGFGLITATSLKSTGLSNIHRVDRVTGVLDCIILYCFLLVHPCTQVLNVQGLKTCIHVRVYPCLADLF